MSPILQALLAALLVSAVSLIGIVFLFTGWNQRRALFFVSFAAGVLLATAFLEILPQAVHHAGERQIFVATLLAMAGFFVLERALHGFHDHHEDESHAVPSGTLILIGDGLHNFLGGIGVAGVFMIDTRLGIMAWLAAAAHEVPQELGDFGVLVHGGWRRSSALLFNLLSGTAFLLGSLVTYGLSQAIDVGFLVSFAAGNFLYIAASDLVPEVNKHRSVPTSVVHFAAFAAGLALLWSLREILGGPPPA